MALPLIAIVYSDGSQRLTEISAHTRVKELITGEVILSRPANSIVKLDDLVSSHASYSSRTYDGIRYTFLLAEFSSPGYEQLASMICSGELKQGVKLDMNKLKQSLDSAVATTTALRYAVNYLQQCKEYSTALDLVESARSRGLVDERTELSAVKKALDSPAHRDWAYYAEKLWKAGEQAGFIRAAAYLAEERLGVKIIKVSRDSYTVRGR